MKKNEDVAVFILTHGRANSQKTYHELIDDGYTGKIYFVIDDKDEQVEQYIENFGDKVIVFSKEKIKNFDTMTNQKEYASVVYARNAVYDIARRVGVRFAFTCDDDISGFRLRVIDGGKLKSYKIHRFPTILSCLKQIMQNSSVGLMGFSQAGAYFGGINEQYKRGYKKDIAQAFMIDTEKQIEFKSILNEDLHASIESGILGFPCLSTPLICICAPERGSNSGGLNDLYARNSTYARAFYSGIAYPGVVFPLVCGQNGEVNIYKRQKYMSPMIINERWKK